MYYIITMRRLSKITDYAFVCIGLFALKPLYSMRATILFKETSLAIYTVQKLLKLLVSKSDLMKTN